MRLPKTVFLFLLVSCARSLYTFVDVELVRWQTSVVFDVVLCDVAVVGFLMLYAKRGSGVL